VHVYHAKGDRKGRPYLLAEILEIYQGIMNDQLNSHDIPAIPYNLSGMTLMGREEAVSLLVGMAGLSISATNRKDWLCYKFDQLKLNSLSLTTGLERPESAGLTLSGIFH